MYLKIRGKLFLAFSVIIFFTIALSLYSYFTINSLNKNLEKMNAVWIASIDAAHEMNITFANYRGNEYRFIATDDPFEISSLEKDMKQKKDTMSELLDEYNNIDMPKEGKNLVSSVKAEWENYLKISDEILSISTEKNNGQAKKIMISDELNQYNELTSSTRELIKFSEDNLLYSYNDNMKAESLSKLILSTIIIVILIISSAIVAILSRGISGRIKPVTSILLKTANFDLEFDTKAYEQIKKFKGNDEFTDMGNALISMRAELRKLVSSIRDSASKVYSNSNSLFSTISETADSIEGIAKATDGIAEASTELAKDVQDGAEKLEQLASEIDGVTQASDSIKYHAAHTGDITNQGMEYVKKLRLAVMANEDVAKKVADQISKLASKSQDVSKITDTIKSIAGQINLLSLNAAIEAARAGEQGRGFAIVADEIRKLANETALSTKEIDNIVNQISHAVDDTKNQITEASDVISETSKATEETESSFIEIDKAIVEIIDQIQSLVDNVHNMDVHKNKVVDTISNMSAIAEESASTTEEISASIQEQSAGVEHISSSANELKKVAEELEIFTERFKI